MLQLTPTCFFASSDLPIALRMRPDLIVCERNIGDKSYFIIKDPIRLSHHQLWEEEFALLQMLDGKSTFGTMRKEFNARFQGSRLEPRRLQILHGQFHRSGLVLSEGYGQADELHRRNIVLRSRIRWGRFRDWMSIRLRGINPDAFLERWNQRMGWCFEWPTLIGVACFILFTILFFVGQSTHIMASIPSINEYLNVQSIVLLYIAFGLLKVIHELGHGLACKHFGGECNEMGVMFLILTPCLYCDVTDSWMVESKWKRAMIASAGVWFELVAASACMWIWWFSNPGIVHSLCFHAMLVGSVGTIFLNGNPLLKYDGYFVLSDLMDRPNLSQQSRQIVSNGLARFFSRRIPSAIVDFSGRGNGFLWIYGLLSGLYKWVVVVVLFFIVYKLFQAFRLEWVGFTLIFISIARMLREVIKGIQTLVSVPGRWDQIRKGRVTVTALASLALLIALVWIPFPARLHSPVYIEVKDAKSVVVVQSGTLVRGKVEGTSVQAGEEIATLVSKDHDLRLISRRGELAKQRARLNGLESRRGEDALIATRIPTVQEAIAGLELEVKRMESDISLLILRAPISGKILAPTTHYQSTQPNALPMWSGTPLDKENVGCVLSRGETYCQIGNTDHYQATAYLTQAQVELVRPGQSVTIKSKSYPNISICGLVSEVDTSGSLDLPEEIALSGLVPHRKNPAGRNESTEPLFAARIELNLDSILNKDSVPLHRSIGNVAIQVDSQTIGARFARLLYSTFAIDPTVQRKAGL